MATKFQKEQGDYDKVVYDSGDKCNMNAHGSAPDTKGDQRMLMASPGQDSKKFSQPNKDVKDYSGVGSTKQKLRQTINKPMDSGEGKGRMKAEGGSVTHNKGSKTYKDGRKMKAPKQGPM